MEEPGGLNPWLFELGFFFLRCGVPLLIIFGLSYIMRRLGLIAPPPKPPAEWNNTKNHSTNPEAANANS